MDVLERAQQRATRVLKDLEQHCCEESLRELGLLHLEQRRLGGDLNNACKFLKGGCKEDGARLFSVRARPRGNEHKLEHRGFPLTIRQHFCAVQLMEPWLRLPKIPCGKGCNAIK